MQDLSVCVVQFDQAWEDKETNYSRLISLTEGVEADLFLFPEMFNTGFTMNKELSEQWNSSDGINWLKNFASQKNAAVYTSLVIQDNEGFYRNRGVFVYPEGSISFYDKRKSFGLAKEDKTYTNGQKENVVTYKGWRFMLQICYDLRFPEIVRNRIDSDHLPHYDVILYVANWPTKRISHFDALLRARAIENQCYAFAVNRVGQDGNEIEYNGHSQFVNALGEVSFCDEGQSVARIFVMKRSELDSTREILPFLKDQV